MPLLQQATLDLKAKTLAVRSHAPPLPTFKSPLMTFQQLEEENQAAHNLIIERQSKSEKMDARIRQLVQDFTNVRSLTHSLIW